MEVFYQKEKKDVCKVPLVFTFIPKSSDIQSKNRTCKRTSFPVNLSDGRPNLVHYSFFLV